MERYALAFTVKPGAEEKAREILSSYGRPVWEVDAETRLLSTTIFMHGNMIVRVLDIEGSLQKVMAHLSRQPEIRAVEAALDPYLEEKRDMTTPEGARAFFQKAMMQPITHRVAGVPMADA